MGVVVPHPLRWVIGAGVGAVVVAASWRATFLDEDSRRWAVAAAVVVVAVLVGEALPDARRLLPEPGAITFVIVASLGAVFACVPETDHLPGIGLTIAGLGVIEIGSRQIMPIALHGLAAALVLWGGVFGATGRQRAVVGALFAFWPLIVLAVVVRLRPRVAGVRVAPRLTIGALGGAAALIVSRTGALRPGRRPALRDAALWGSVSLLAALFVAFAATLATPRRPPR